MFYQTTEVHKWKQNGVRISVGHNLNSSEVWANLVKTKPVPTFLNLAICTISYLRTHPRISLVLALQALSNCEYNFSGLEDLTAVLLTFQVFWHMMLCGLVSSY